MNAHTRTGSTSKRASWEDWLKGHSEKFHGFWSRDSVVMAVLSAAAARGVKVSVYKQRRLTLMHRKPQAILEAVGGAVGGARRTSFSKPSPKREESTSDGAAPKAERQQSTSEGVASGRV